MTWLPRTGMNHSLNVAWFALRCLGYALTHRPSARKARP